MAKVHAFVVPDELTRYGIIVVRDFLIQGHVVMVKRWGCLILKTIPDLNTLEGTEIQNYLHDVMNTFSRLYLIIDAPFRQDKHIFYTDKCLSHIPIAYRS